MNGVDGLIELIRLMLSVFLFFAESFRSCRILCADSRLRVFTLHVISGLPLWHAYYATPALRVGFFTENFDPAGKARVTRDTFDSHLSICNLFGNDSKILKPKLAVAKRKSF